MVFFLNVGGLWLAEQAIVNALDPLANYSPIKIGKDGRAGVRSKPGSELAILQQCHNPTAERFTIVIRDNEGVVQVAHPFGRAFKADNWLSCQHVVQEFDRMPRAFRA